MDYSLGISAFYHDSAAALIADGNIIAAVQEERFTRKKHDPGFPKYAVQYCLQEAGINLSQLNSITFYDKPLLKFERLLETYVALAPRGFRSFSQAMPIWLKEKLFQKHLVVKNLKSLDLKYSPDVELLFAEHHQSHAASAFFPSPFEEAIVLTMDGVGEWATMSVALGQNNKLTVLKEIHFPHSLGLLYSAFTYYTGFRVNSGEYKVMGLAPYGKPVFKDIIFDKLIDLKEDGSFRLNQEYFNYCSGLTMTNKLFDQLFGGPPRKPDQLIQQRHMDLAASIQAVTEEVVLKISRSIAREYEQKNLCLAGGVALNCVCNGKILEDRTFEKIWVQPAAGDAGGALGAAFMAYHGHFGYKRKVSRSHDKMHGSYLGPKYRNQDVESRLKASGATFELLDEETIISNTAKALADGKAVGWFQGRMEFGPRALGGRSILGDPRSPKMQKTLNLRVKYRESFRPFAPSVLREDLSDYFELDEDSPYMLMVASIVESRRKAMTRDEEELFGIDKLNVPRSDIPAVTHVDYSARIQTVHQETNPRYYKLLKEFKALTGCSVLVNTSFNVRGEPIVCTPEDAFRCFMGSEIEVLVIENALLFKENQNPDLKLDYKNAFELD
jgi:carbamoyltransferase